MYIYKTKNNIILSEKKKITFNKLKKSNVGNQILKFGYQDCIKNTLQ